MRRTALAAVVLLIAASVPVAMASPAAAAATVTVTPSTDLGPGAGVAVTGGGFDPNVQLEAGECKAGALDPSDCDVTTGRFPFADGSGNFDFSDFLNARLATTSDTFDCTTAAGACEFVIAPISDLSLAARTPLSFAPLPAPRAGALHAPSAPVAADEGIQISVTGFAPEVLLAFGRCAVEATSVDQCNEPFIQYTDQSGAIDGFINTPSTLDEKGGGSVDCTVNGNCDIAVWDVRDFTTLTTAPLRIAPEVPGTIVVTPATGLHDQDIVTVTGSGWPAQEYLEIDECTSADNCPLYGSAITGDDGTFTTSYKVRSHSVGLQPYFNCETDPCSMRASWFTFNTTVTKTAPIAFDTTTTPVTSHYTADQLAAVSGAATQLGVSNAQLQRLGTFAFAWVLGLTRSGTITPAPNTGPGTITTDWIPSEYSGLSDFAARYGTTIPEFQKTGALFVAFVLALR